MDCYHNYSNKYLEYDVFVAISHGQNRGILKKGKIGESYNVGSTINLKNIKLVKTLVQHIHIILIYNYYLKQELLGIYRF